MKQHKLIVFSILLIISSTLNAQTQVSPYVENGNTVNNSGFNASMLRSTTLTRPVSPHLSTDAINNKVSPKFLVATSDYNSSNTILWAQACGWTAASNTNTSSAIVASPATGCNQYSQTGYPAGTWRVPTQREMIIIYLLRKELTAVNSFNTTAYVEYWTSTIFDGSNVWCVDFGLGLSYNRATTSNYLLRCVTDL